MVPIKRNLQCKGFLFREAEKKMGAEISIRGNKGPSLIPTGSLKTPLSLSLLKHFPFRTSQPTTAGAALPTINQGSVLIAGDMGAALSGAGLELGGRSTGTSRLGPLGWPLASSTPESSGEEKSMGSSHAEKR